MNITLLFPPFPNFPFPTSCCQSFNYLFECHFMETDVDFLLCLLYIYPILLLFQYSELLWEFILNTYEVTWYSNFSAYISNFAWFKAWQEAQYCYRWKYPVTLWNTEEGILNASCCLSSVIHYFNKLIFLFLTYITFAYSKNIFI